MAGPARAGVRSENGQDSTLRGTNREPSSGAATGLSEAACCSGLNRRGNRFDGRHRGPEDYP
jgi:hypothetical protein